MQKNIQELRNSLIDLFCKIESGEVKPPTAKEMSNAAGKILSTVKMEIDYIGLKQKVKGLNIEFLEPR